MVYYIVLRTVFLDFVHHENRNTGTESNILLPSSDKGEGGTHKAYLFPPPPLQLSPLVGFAVLKTVNTKMAAYINRAMIRLCKVGNLSQSTRRYNPEESH
jgi:hypothetical protein